MDGENNSKFDTLPLDTMGIQKKKLKDKKSKVDRYRYRINSPIQPIQKDPNPQPPEGGIVNPNPIYAKKKTKITLASRYYKKNS